MKTIDIHEIKKLEVVYMRNPVTDYRFGRKVRENAEQAFVEHLADFGKKECGVPIEVF